MFITRECDYAMRVIRALAGGTRRSVEEICEEESITAPFAYKILKKLHSAGMVKGFRGVHGGYVLSKSLDELTLYDVYYAIDPDMFIIECLNPGKSCVRNGGGDAVCLVHRELQDIQNELWKGLKRKKLSELLLPENAKK